jgi:adenine-specific DNA-methyltransferase
MIKYLGSKRMLVPALGRLFAASGASTALDLFTGTTRVAQEFCRRGGVVTAVDTSTYSEVLARCYVELDAATVDLAEVAEAVAHLTSLPPVRGYVTETFCERSRYFQPKNGMRIDAIRDGIEEFYADSWLRPVLLTSLMQAADVVDSTVGLQMAYLKQWAGRSFNDLTMRVPVLTPGRGRAVRGDAAEVVPVLPRVDLAYLDPPYNQHRYFTNYHVWETLVRWDAPEFYGTACKRVDSREPETKSVFNRKREMPAALAQLIAAVDAEVLVVSFSDEGYVPLADLVDMCRVRGQAVEVLSFDSRRYIGSRIGIFNASGAKVGSVGRTHNTEYLVLSGEADRIAAMAAAVSAGTVEPAVTAGGTALG